LLRGVYAKNDLEEGHILTDEDVYLAIPLQKGQISCRELMRGEVLLRALRADEAIMIDDIDSPYASIPSLKTAIYARGLERNDNASRTNDRGAAAADKAYSVKYELGYKKGEA
jgi:N-acetylneuraminate synthase